jgi:hypothetical protein
MSRSNNKSKSFGKKVIPSCSHCRNLGLKFDHWLRESTSYDSPIVCPVLLKTECRYCHKLGHNISKCQILANSKKEKKEKPFVSTTNDSIKNENIIQSKIELDKKSYASITKKLLDVLHKKPVEKEEYKPPARWVYHGRMDWTEHCDSSDDEDN